MNTTQVSIINTTEPIVFTGKHFTGDYSNANLYITEVQQILTAAGIAFAQNKVIGVYYDNPQDTPVADLKSFHGVFITDDSFTLPGGLTNLSIDGQYLYTEVTGDPMKAIMVGYGALFTYIDENGMSLKTPAGYQISTFENNEITTEIYMELA